MGRLDARTDWRVKLGGDWPGDMTLSTTMVDGGEQVRERQDLGAEYGIFESVDSPAIGTG